MPRLLSAAHADLTAVAYRLRAGGVVAFPTETVYGLGADTFSGPGVAQIYALKGRPADNPLIAHVLDETMAKMLVAEWPDRCAALADAFWPGPLTVIVPRRPEIPDASAAGLPTIAVRAPRHNVALELLEVFGGPVSAPSANRSGRISPTTAAHVAADFSDVDDLWIIDCGPCEGGLESTVVDTTDPERVRVLRPGSISAEDIRNVLGQVDDAPVMEQGASPGTARRHYAPQTPTVLIDAAALTRAVTDTPHAIVVVTEDVEVTPQVAVLRMPRTAAAYAARLYAALREADAADAERIVIVRPAGDGGVWEAVHDRLRRAAE